MPRSITRRRITTITATAVATALAVSALLAAPATQPAGPDPLPPQTTAPARSPKANLVPVPYRPVLPPAVVSRDPRMVPADRSHRLHAEAAIDLPPLADSSSPLPGEPALPAGPAIRITSDDPAALPVDTIAALPDTGRPSLQTDPTTGLTESGALMVKPPPRKTPPPAQWLSIPDPAHQVGYVPTPVAAAEDAPVMTLDRPGPTTLPVSGK
ncbi:MAG TPA: hypothetical protein VFE47_01515 [Tepidisphaeraceae bacterium]|jgi:hypothetical protein|nr:hypothetical protein [Tepidisphaeraceae bacterium]